MHNNVSLLQSRFQRLETSRHHIVLNLEKAKPFLLKYFFAAQFSNLGLLRCRHMVTLVLPHTQHATKRANQAAMAANLCT